MAQKKQTAYHFEAEGGGKNMEAQGKTEGQIQILYSQSHLWFLFQDHSSGSEKVMEQK